MFGYSQNIRQYYTMRFLCMQAPESNNSDELRVLFRIFLGFADYCLTATSSASSIISRKVT